MSLSVVDPFGKAPTLGPIFPPVLLSPCLAARGHGTLRLVQGVKPRVCVPNLGEQGRSGNDNGSPTVLTKQN